MNYRLIVRPEVDRDLLEAEQWYEQQVAGLGQKFLQAARQKMAELPRNPFLYRVRHARPLAEFLQCLAIMSFQLIDILGQQRRPVLKSN